MVLSKGIMIFILKDPYISFIIFIKNRIMETSIKNVKISSMHHKMLKSYCEKNGLKIGKILEKWIEDRCRVKKSDIYGEL